MGYRRVQWSPSPPPLSLPALVTGLKPDSSVAGPGENWIRRVTVSGTGWLPALFVVAFGPE